MIIIYTICFLCDIFVSPKTACRASCLSVGCSILYTHLSYWLSRRGELGRHHLMSPAVLTSKCRTQIMHHGTWTIHPWSLILIIMSDTQASDKTVDQPAPTTGVASHEEAPTGLLPGQHWTDTVGL